MVRTAGKRQFYQMASVILPVIGQGSGMCSLTSKSQLLIVIQAEIGFTVFIMPIRMN